MYPRLIWKLPGDEPVLYLTFDDGPQPGVTEPVLDILKEYDARATFFCVGGNIERFPETFARIRSGGHAAGNHTYHHLNGWRTDDGLYFESVERTRALVGNGLFRPPYGRIKRSQIARLAPRYKIVMWSVLSYDFDAGVSREKCLQNVIRRAGPGDIVTFHDSWKAEEKLLWVLPRVLAHFREKGLRFGVIGEKS
jgi:peptidoglycan/xylan/chitin deacetylase (PgdA/CDA1 family)